MARRHIYGQGMFDGACFLYAVANAYTALTGRSVTLSLWDRAIRGLPYLREFLSGHVGTDHYRNDPHLLRFAMDRMLGALSRNVRFRVEHTDCSTLEEVATLLGQRSVALLCMNRSGGSMPAFDHWVCVVGASESPQRLRLACSWKYQQDRDEYKERQDRDFGRWYNDSLVEESAVLPRTVFRVMLEGKRRAAKGKVIGSAAQRTKTKGRGRR